MGCERRFRLRNHTVLRTGGTMFTYLCTDQYEPVWRIAENRAEIQQKGAGQRLVSEPTAHKTDSERWLSIPLT
jgi:hypothetical protein